MVPLNTALNADVTYLTSQQGGIAQLARGTTGNKAKTVLNYRHTYQRFKWCPTIKADEQARPAINLKQGIITATLEQQVLPFNVILCYWTPFFNYGQRNKV